MSVQGNGSESQVRVQQTSVLLNILGHFLRLGAPPDLFPRRGVVEYVRRTPGTCCRKGQAL